MKDEIYVGPLISEDELAHSSGPWKKHKYIKKIGDTYYYSKEALGKAAKNFGKKASDLVDDAVFEAEWQAGRAANAIGNAADTIAYNAERATGLDLKREYNVNKAKEQRHRDEASRYQNKADNLNDVAVREHTFLNPKDPIGKALMESTSDDRRRAIQGQRYHTKRASEYHEKANAYKRRYSVTPAGKAESAVNKGVETITGLFERRKKKAKKKK